MSHHEQTVATAVSFGVVLSSWIYQAATHGVDLMHNVLGVAAFVVMILINLDKIVNNTRLAASLLAPLAAVLIRTWKARAAKP